MLLLFCAYPNNTVINNQPEAYWASVAAINGTLSWTHVSHRTFRFLCVSVVKVQISSCFAGLLPTVNVGVNSLSRLPAFCSFTTLSSTPYGGNIQRPFVGWVLVGSCSYCDKSYCVTKVASVWLSGSLASLWLVASRAHYAGKSSPSLLWDSSRLAVTLQPPRQHH
jgi:hypothetical protein